MDTLPDIVLETFPDIVLDTLPDTLPDTVLEECAWQGAFLGALSAFQRKNESSRSSRTTT